MSLVAGSCPHTTEKDIKSHVYKSCMDPKKGSAAEKGGGLQMSTYICSQLDDEIITIPGIYCMRK